MEEEVKNPLSFEEIDNLFGELLKKCMDDLHPNTSKRILEARASELEEKIIIYKNFKYQAINRKHEQQANIFFLMQCTLSSVKCAFNSLQLFKEEDNHNSWHSLIDATEYIDIAIKVGETLTRNFCEHLKEEHKKHVIFVIKERLHLFCSGLFRPDLKFTSPGIIESIGNCSICGLQFHKCDHSEGDIVMGNYCQRINRKILDADHSAFVEHPKDKRCILITTFDTEGNSIDFFSREPTEKKNEPNTYEFIVHHFGGIDLR